MKTAPATDPLAAFPDPGNRPADDDLGSALGRAWPRLHGLLEWLRAAQPDLTGDWRFSSRAGWYHTQMKRKRRLFYLVPLRGDYRLSIILGGKAIATLSSGPHADRIQALLKTARRYPEGTLFEFDRASFEPGLFATLIAAKLSPVPLPPFPSSHAHPRP